MLKIKYLYFLSKNKNIIKIAPKCDKTIWGYLGYGAKQNKEDTGRLFRPPPHDFLS